MSQESITRGCLHPLFIGRGFRFGGAAAALLLAGSASWGVDPVVIDFDGSLPGQATLVRDTARIDSEGGEAPANVGRFVTGAVGSGAIMWALLPEDERVLVAREVGGTTYTVVNLGCGLAMTTDTPGLTTPTYILPDSSVQSKLGCFNAPWGRPKYAEIHPDGTILVVSTAAGPEARMVILRTTVSTFTDPDGFSLVFTSPYAPPQGYGTTTIGFGHSTDLPHLGITVSTLAEYAAAGLASTAYPGDGRSLGFGSSDGGVTWTRLIDTDDLTLGRQFFPQAKHLHRLQAFEWYDAQESAWKIGAVGLLGDGGGASGEIFCYAPGATYPPEGQNSLLMQERTKVDTARMLTDLFPVNVSGEPGNPLMFLQGPDGESAGIVRTTVEGPVQHDEFVFRPTIPWKFNGQRRIFNRFPYIFDFGRLGNGCLVAPLFDTHDEINPNGMWMSDPTGAYWTTVNLLDGDGFRTATPFGDNLMWTQISVGNRPTQTVHSSLWDFSPPVVRESLEIGCGARDVQSLGLPTEGEPTVTNVTGSEAPPRGTPAGTSVYRIQSETMVKNQAFWGVGTTLAGVQAGEWITVEYWVKPAKLDMGVQYYDHTMTLSLPGGGTQESHPMQVEPSINDWQRVMLVEQAPESGEIGVTVSALMEDDASVLLPLDYYVTDPQVYVTAQPTSQRFEAGKEGGDRLTVDLPAMGSSWSVMVNGTEARMWVMSLVASNGDAAIVEPRVFQFPVTDPDLKLHEGVNVALELSTVTSSVAQFGGRSHETDNCFPAQNVVALTLDGELHRLTMWVSRGLGELDEIKVAGVTLTPEELRFGTPDWSLGFEGLVHTVKVWPDRAITREEVELERFGGRFSGFPPEPVICYADIDGDGFTTVFDFAILAQNFGGTGGFAEGDLDGDGAVTVFDFAILAAEFGCEASE